MKIVKLVTKLISILLAISLVLSLAGCLSVDKSSSNAAQNTETEYRHIKNTYHNYINNNSSNDDSDDSNNDSSDYLEQDDVDFVPDSLIPNTDDNKTQEDENDENSSDDEDLPPEINYEDVVKVPETEIFSDDFESYGEDGTFIVKYEMNGGDTVEGFVTTDAVEGNYAARFKRTLGSAQWAAVQYNFKGDTTDYNFQNWKDQKYLSFWAKTDGQQQAYRIGVNDGVRTSWYSIDKKVTSEWTFFSVKLEDFLHKDFLYENVKYIALTWSGGNATTYIDDIRVTEKEIKQYNQYIPVGDATTIENAEYYEGDELGVKAAYSLLEGNDYAITAVVDLDGTEKKTGDYSIKFTAKPEENKTTAIYTAKLGQDMLITKFNEVKLNLKGNGLSGQKVDVMLFDEDTQVVGQTFELSADWKEEILNATIPNGVSGIKFNRIVLTTALADTDSVFWLDDFVLANKDGVLATPADMIEDGEYYTDTYKVTDAYSQDENATSKINVSLDNTNKYAGNNSVKFSVPAGAASNVDEREFANGTSGNLQSWGGNSWSHTETFDTPIDLSGGDGVIRIKANLNKGGTLYHKIRINTTNKNSSYIGGKYAGGNASSNINSVDYIVSLADIGLTDEDLKSVTGYFVEFVGNCPVSSKATYSLSCPKTEEDNLQLLYSFQPKQLSEGKHFKLQIRGDNAAETQGIKLEVLTAAGAVIGEKDFEFASDGNWKELYIANVTGVAAVAVSVRITFPSTNVAREIWLDDFVIFSPERPTVDSPNIIDEFEHYNEFFPIDNDISIEKSAKYDTKFKAYLTDGTDEYGKVRNGKYALKLEANDFKSGTNWYATAYQDLTSRDVHVKPGDKVSLWACLTKCTKGELKVRFETTNGSTSYTTIQLQDNDWHEVVIDTSKLKGEGKITKITYFIGNLAGDSVICVDDFKIIEN